MDSIKGFVFLLLTALAAKAQFYAPPVERHDPVQRMFVVEMARVAAAFENEHFPGIAEVKYEVTTKADGTTVWQLRWVDASGKDRLTGVVEYPSTLLESGAAFYRELSLKVTEPGFKRRLHPIKASEVTEGYWKGASSLGWSREETLAKAMAIASRLSEDEVAAVPELAGALSHAALFGIGGRLSIDPMIAARGAAWLTLAERMSSEKLDALWGPTLFLGGREKAASELWQSTHEAALKSAKPAEAGWNVWLRRPDSRELYRFALTDQPGHLQMGVPMLIYDAIVSQTGDFLTDTLIRVLGADVRELHNYGPALTSVSFAGGRMMEGAWSLLQRRAWVGLLEKVKPTTNDFAAYRPDLDNASKFFSAKIDLNSKADPSLVGLNETAPLIKLGKTEGVGPLIPTAVATTRDLLNYGWEMTGLQMGSRWRFARDSWGVPDLAREIYSGALADVEGILPFFHNEADAKSTTYREMLTRLQLVDGLQWRVGWSPNPFADASRINADLFMKRGWMRPMDLDWQVRSLWDDGKTNEMASLFEYQANEGGAMAAAYALTYFGSLSKEAMQEVPNASILAKRFTAKIPYVTAHYFPVFYDTLFKGRNNCEVAMRMEKVYWTHPESQLEAQVFRNYAVAGANKSASRFYLQARPFFQRLSPVKLGNVLGRNAYLFAYATGDRELRKAALEDSDSASHTDMRMHVWEDLIEGDFRKLGKGIDEMIERYGEGSRPDSPDRKLQAFVPLLGALQQANHPRHEEALRFFAGSKVEPIFRWICIEQFKLPPNEAIQFLGGRETDLFRRALVAYLEKDLNGMLGFINKYGASAGPNGESILLMQLFIRLKGDKPPCPETDFKPKDVQSLHGVIDEMLAKRTPRAGR